MAHVLVAEDQPSVRDYVVRALETFGHSAVAVNDGGAALGMLEKQNFDLLITDIVMPVMDGVALALAVSEKWPQLPIIMMSGYPNERQRAYNLQDLITEVLSKPFTLNEFKAIVEQTLAQK